jgi:hypothetical protein
MRPVARHRIERAAFGLLDASPLCAISTVSPRTTTHIHTAYFVWNRDLEIFWLSDPAARHSRNIRVRPSTAIAVYDSHQVWGRPDRGIQLLDRRVNPSKEIAYAESLYAARFPGYATPDLRAYRLYRFRTERLKVLTKPCLRRVSRTRLSTATRLIWEQRHLSGAEATRLATPHSERALKWRSERCLTLPLSPSCIMPRGFGGPTASLPDRGDQNACLSWARTAANP